jgi:hypothetical protein
MRAAVIPAILVSLLSLPARGQAPLDPCLECGRIYASTAPGDLYVVDPDAGTATFIGTSFPNFTDIGITGDGRLFGVSFDGDLYLIDTCDASATFFDPGYYGTGLTTDPAGSDTLLVAGPPLGRIDTGSGSVAFIGGNVLGPPPLWCGPMSGDLVVSPVDGTIYGTLQCACGSGDTLATIDPATGEIIAEIGCIHDAAGIGYTVYGLVFDAQCRLFGAPSAGPFLLEIDPATAEATQVPIAGGLDGGFGVAFLPCPGSSCAPAVPPRCEPLTQGFWKRQCRGRHPSRENEHLDEYASCVAASLTFGAAASADDECRALNPSSPRDKCQQADAQLMALLLNACSGRLDRACCIDSSLTSAVTVGEAIDEIDALLANPGRRFRDCVRAQAIADAINTGAALCAP